MSCSIRQLFDLDAHAVQKALNGPMVVSFDVLYLVRRARSLQSEELLQLGAGMRAVVLRRRHEKCRYANIRIRARRIGGNVLKAHAQDERGDKAHARPAMIP